MWVDPKFAKNVEIKNIPRILQLNPNVTPYKIQILLSGVRRKNKGFIKLSGNVNSKSWHVKNLVVVLVDGLHPCNKYALFHKFISLYHICWLVIVCVGGVNFV